LTAIAVRPTGQMGGQSAVLFGDSITGLNYAASTGYYSEGYFNWANALLGMPFTTVYPLGVGGDTTALMLARIQAVVNTGADWAFVMGGTNDIFTSPTSTDYAAIFANLKQIYSTLLNAGMKVVAVTPPVRNTGSQANAQIVAQLELNRLILSYAAATPNMIGVNAYGATVSPTDASGNQKTNYLYDSTTHPSNIGAYAIGKAVKAQLEFYLPPTQNLLESIADNNTTWAGSKNLLSTGLFQGSGGSAGTGASGTVPTGWTASRSSGAAGTSVVMSVPARSDGFGNNLTLTVTGDAAETTGLLDVVCSSFHAQVTAGDVLRARCLVSVGSPVAIKGFYLRLSVTAGGVTTTYFSMVNQQTDVAMAEGITDCVFETPPLTVPSGSVTAATLSLRARVGASASGTVSFARASVLKE